MNLFDNSTSIEKNILTHDGLVTYFGKLMDNALANHYFNSLLHSLEWKNDEAILFGKRIITKRKVAWYADQNYEYTYSNTTKKALIWTTILSEIKSIVEQKSNEKFNSCLVNLYHNGDEGMAWHSDAEKDLLKNGTIASISFGAERKFSFKHKETKETISILLENSSLLLMKKNTQENWLHRLPPSKKIKDPRINLTFRTIAE